MAETHEVGLSNNSLLNDNPMPSPTMCLPLVDLIVLPRGIPAQGEVESGTISTILNYKPLWNQSLCSTKDDIILQLREQLSQSFTDGSSSPTITSQQSLTIDKQVIEQIIMLREDYLDARELTIR